MNRADQKMQEYLDKHPFLQETAAVQQGMVRAVHNVAGPVEFPAQDEIKAFTQTGIPLLQNKEIQEKMGLTDEQMKTVNYRLLQEYEVPDWVKLTKEKEKEGEKIDHVEIGGKEMRIRKHVNYCEDYEGDFYDGSMSEDRSNLHRKRKKDNSISGMDSFEQENSRSHKKKKFGSESNSIRQNSQVDLANLGDDKNRNVNINLGGGGNKVQIHLRDDDDEDDNEQGDNNTFKSEDKIHLDEDEEEENEGKEDEDKKLIN